MNRNVPTKSSTSASSSMKHNKKRKSNNTTNDAIHCRPTKKRLQRISNKKIHKQLIDLNHDKEVSIMMDMSNVLIESSNMNVSSALTSSDDVGQSIENHIHDDNHTMEKKHLKVSTDTSITSVSSPSHNDTTKKHSFSSFVRSTTKPLLRIETNIDDTDTDMIVPSPPPFLRSTAQVLLLNYHSKLIHFPPVSPVTTTTKHHLSDLENNITSNTTTASTMTQPFAAISNGTGSSNMISMMKSNNNLLLSSSPVSIQRNKSSNYKLFRPLPKAISKATTTKKASKQGMSIRSAISSDIVDNQLFHNGNMKEMIPASLISGKVISTKYGLAVLVVPSTYSDTFVSSKTNVIQSETSASLFPTSNLMTTTMTDVATIATSPSLVTTTTTTTTTRFKHWIQKEDELLQYAISKQIGPPYKWQEIAQTYFPTTRNANQVR
jgi:ribosomal protein L18